MNAITTLGDPLRVVTVNAYGATTLFRSARFESLCKEVARLTPHIILFQEVVRQWQVDTIRRHFSLTHATHTPASSRRSLILPGNLGGLLTLLRRDRFTTDTPEFVPFTQQYDPKSPLTRADALLTKGVFIVPVKDERSHAHFEVLNTHLAAPYGKLPTAGPLQLSQLEELEHLLTPGTRRIIGADLNMTPTEIPPGSRLRRFKEAFGFEGTEITVSNQNPLRRGPIAQLSGRGGDRPDKRVDYVFASWGFVFCTKSAISLTRSVNYKNYTGPVTDHYAISTQVQMEY